MTSQGTAGGRFTRAIQQRNLWAAETALRELGEAPSLEYALAYLDLLAEQKPEKLERACVRWHGRLETEATLLSLAESQLALAALASLCAGERGREGTNSYCGVPLSEIRRAVAGIESTLVMMARPPDRALQRLAQYRPFDDEGLSGSGALMELVLASAVEGDGAVPSIASCRDTCRAFWGLDVEIDELRDAFESLEQDGRVVRENGHYRLSGATTAELERRLEESRKIEQQALEDWEASVRANLDSSLTPAEMDELREDLDKWLNQVIARHGIESALLLYPELPRAQKMFDRLEGVGINFLPRRRGKLEQIREQALYLFVRQPTDAQRTVLSNLLNTGYLMTILTLDPSAGRLVQDLTRGQRVYVDTNFVYRILNLQGPRLHLSAKRLLELTHALGYETVVTPWTITELQESLERAKTFLMSRPIPPAELAEIAAAATTDENFVTAYWRRLKEKPVSVKDFFDYYAQIETHLEQYGITVEDEGCKAVDGRKDAINEELSVIDNALGRAYRHESVKEHDVKHRLLVQRLRANANRRFSNAGYWFLTCDSLLPRYDRAAAQGTAELPFCVTASAWLQVMRSFTPRTDDYDQTLADLLASPYLRYRGPIRYTVVQEVMGRIDLYDGATPELAAKVLLDSALLREVAETPEEAEREKKIHNAIVVAAAQREHELAEALKREEAERQARRAAEQEKGAIASQLEQKEQSEADLQGELERERREHERELREAQERAEREHQEHEREERERHRLEKELDDLNERRKHNKLITLAAAALVLGVLVAVLPITLGVVSGGWWAAAFALAGLTIASAGLIPLVGRAWAVTALVGIATLVPFVIAIHDATTKHK